MQWLTAVIPTTQEVEMGRILVQDQPQQQSWDPSLNKKAGYG
jgi:hypothetical protein